MAEEFPFGYIPPPDPNLGRRVDQNFVLKLLLGRGGMGAAYLAEHEALPHVKCVIKVMLAELLRQPMAISRYKTEAEALAVLKHDNIVKLQNFGVLDDGQLFQRFEYIEGKSLDRWVTEQGGRLLIRKAAYILFQACDALQYAHESGVIHRDLKPDNLMVEIAPKGSHLQWRVKILDFGIAKIVNAQTGRTGSGMSMGTPGYMAPEQITNAAAATGRADVFSLAVILYVLVTGRRPWGAAETDVEIYYKQRTEGPERPPEHLMSLEVAKLVMRALSLVPEDRPTMHEFALGLARAIPRESELESGTEILSKVVPGWVASSPHYAQTLPRPVALDPDAIAPKDPRAAVPAVRPDRDALRPANDALALVRRTPVAIPTQTAGSSPPPPDVTVTASQRPSARGASGAPGGRATSGAQSAPGAAVVPVEAAGSSMAAPLGPMPPRPATPVLAALPTGLLSHSFNAPKLPPDAREPPVAVASEIVLAAATPGPQPYAHTELPPVLVAHAQLAEPSGASRAAAYTIPPPPPSPVLAGRTSGPASQRKLVATGVLALVVVAATAFVIVRRERHDSARGTGESIASPRAPGDVLAPRGATEGSTPALNHPSGVAVATQPQRQGTGQHAPTVDVGATAQNAPAAQHGSQAGPAPTATRPTAPAGMLRPPMPAGAPATNHGGQAAPAQATTSAPEAAMADGSRKSPASDAAATGELKPAQQAPAPAAQQGVLAVEVDSWASIWLNGKQDEAPYRAKLAAGRYRLRIQHEDKDETMTVVVRPGEITTIKRNW